MKNIERLALAVLWFVRFVLPTVSVYFISLHIIAPMVGWLPPISVLIALISISYVTNGYTAYLHMCEATSGPRIFLLNPGGWGIAEVSLWALLWPILLLICFFGAGYINKMKYKNQGIFSVPANDQ